MRFDLILADCPWVFAVRSPKGEGRTPQAHYPCMTTDELCRMPVYSFAEKNAVLLLWGVMRSLPDALKVIDAWGFQYKTVAWVWVKRTKAGKPAMGTGYYTRQNAELCLLATRGKPLRVATHSEIAIIESVRREHSRKPDEQYEKIDRLFPKATKLELFARHKQPGWSVWGNEVESDIQMPMQGRLF